MNPWLRLINQISNSGEDKSGEERRKVR